MSRLEKPIQNDILMDLSALDGGIFWRNNTGQAWQGKRVDLAPGAYVRIEPGMVVLKQARPIRFGLEGSSDIIGAYSRRAVAVEVKREKGGRMESSQPHFRDAWVKAGGLYVLARSVEEARDGVLLG